MEVTQALAALTNFDIRTKNLIAGVVKESKERCNLAFLVHFYAQFYHVLVRVIICTRGNVLENNIILDTRQKSRIESLVCANFELRPAPPWSERSLAVRSVGTTEGMRRQETACVVRTILKEILEQAHNEPEKMVQMIGQVASWSSGTSARISRDAAKRGGRK